MNLAATILIPTHDHGPTLRASVASALNQSVSDIEVFVIGDGVPEETREIINEFQRTDPRVRFFDRPKGPRHGEIYRHEALAQARGRIVCYLSDDDLFLPDHVRHMSTLLEQADFAHALATNVHPDGTLSPWTVDLALPAFQRELMDGRNRVPFSSGAHTLDAYRRLETGWTSAPASEPTDQHMWRKFLAHPGCRFEAGYLPTVLVFPAAARVLLSREERLQEMETWLARTAQGTSERILQRKARDAAEADARLIDWVSGRGALQQEYSLQIFHPAAAAHIERNSVYLPARTGEWLWIEHEFLYPVTDLPIRIDPGDLPGLIQLTGIVLSARGGQVLWQLEEQTSQDVQIGGTAVLLSAGRDLRLVSHGKDPQVLLPRLAMPAEDYRVRLELSIRLDADVETLAAAFNAHLNLLQENLKSG